MKPAVSIKPAAWWLLARVAGWTSEAIRRTPCPRSASEWRGVNFSYSQFGEDRVIWALLQSVPQRAPRGIYVDVGAFDPVRYSNTLLLHQHGWRGVNIDVSPDCVARFRQARPGDSHVCAAVSDRSQEMVYLSYPSEATNRLASPSDLQTASVLNESPVAARSVTTRTLDAILGDLTSPPAAIDLLTIDCEGEDLNVLRGFDVARWRPLVIAIEVQNAGEGARVIDCLLQPFGYTSVARTVATTIYGRPPVLPIRGDGHR